MDPSLDRPTFFSLGPPGSSRRRAIFFAVTGTALVLILAVFREVLAPFALGVILAYVLAPAAHGLTRIPFGRWRLPKWVAVVILYVALLGGLTAGVAVGAPRVAAETQRLLREAPRAVHALREEWIPRVEDLLERAGALSGAEPAEETPEPSAEPPADQIENIRVTPREDGGYDVHLPSNGIRITRDEREWRVEVAEPRRRGADLGQVLDESLQRALSESEHYVGAAVRQVQTLVTQVVGGVFSFFIMLMISAYTLITSDRILDFLRSMARPERRHRFDALVHRIDKGLAGVVRGQLIIALVNGVLSGIGFWLADLRYWPLLTLIATVLSVIPIFGAIISSIPAVIIGLQDGLGTGLFVLAWIVGIHQLEANLFNPKIMGDAAKVHPVLVVFALLAGEHLFGITGALLAVPALSIVQSVFLHFREGALEEEPPPPAEAKGA